MEDKFKKSYDPKEFEDAIYVKWEESGFFNPDTCVEKKVCKSDAEPFSMILPPPNATGTLHTGHALMLVIQDIMTRFARMQGKKTLWLPGTDHASIATESKVTKLLEKDGIRKHEIGREEFLGHVDKFVSNSQETIRNQMKKMGASLDWSREAFTLDKERQIAVKTAFEKLYELGLIYRGYRIVNWDPKGQTVISDDEVIHEEREAKLYYFKYSSDFPITIATTRPETKLGDTAVAVHPSDKRYAQYIGKEYSFVFVGEQVTLKIIGDESVDPKFGTGALGVTPAHSQIDAELGERHNLKAKQVINEYAQMIVGMEGVIGEKTTVARERIVEWLKENSLLEKEEKIIQNISTAERTGGIIEPLLKKQWFIAVNKKFKIPHSEIDGIKSGQEVTLKELMTHAVKSKQVKILPLRFEKIYYNWIDNLHDWCISRQIWYGHRIPVWYKEEEIYVGSESKGDDWVQDPDTLDTWFSSGLWTFSTLGWPNDTKDLKEFHPTTIMETGHDIIFFWVARMILMSTSLLGQIPFKTVYMHGMVRDEKGRKMSKSLGNITDPLDLIQKYGTDALRMAMIVGNGPGNDLNLGEEKIRAYSKFANKIWNATRFVLEQTQDVDMDSVDLSDIDKKYIDELNTLIKEITPEMEEYKFYIVGEKLYHYFWHTFADIIIEDSKKRIRDGKEVNSAKYTLLHILKTSLTLLHPFMPFITEEIWKSLSTKELIIQPWPK